MDKPDHAAPAVTTPGFAMFARALMESHLIFFLIVVFAILHPGKPPLRPVWYLFAMCFALEEAAAGRKRRLVVNVPPRYTKSIAASVALVAWCLGRDPTLKIMVATYSKELGAEHAEHTRIVMESKFYKWLFPNTRINPRHNRQLDFETTAGGGRQSVSVSGSITGFGADIIILDDCMKADDIASQTMRDGIKHWFGNTMSSRLNNSNTGTIISIQQRLGEDDLSGLLLDLGAEHFCLPVMAEKVERIPIGPGRVYVRPIGELLDPERHDLNRLDEKRREMGPAAYSAQFQQEPVPPGGNIIPIASFPRYEGPIERDWFQRVVQSWDTGFDDTPTSDFSVCTIWGFREGDWYLLYVYRKRLKYPDLRDAVLRLQHLWKADKVIIERAGTGIPLWQELARLKRQLRPVMYTPRLAKEERMRGQLGLIEDGRILLPEEAPWLDAFL
ncbi:MAG: terminase family protein [Sphingomonadaceae bacterium]